LPGLAGRLATISGVISVAERVYTSPMTCGLDGLAHEVTDENFAQGRRPGHCAALCGHTVSLTPAITPVGRACPQCVDLLLASHGLVSDSISVDAPARHDVARRRQHGRLWALLRGQLSGREVS
jgi:hypothetical protein